MKKISQSLFTAFLIIGLIFSFQYPNVEAKGKVSLNKKTATIYVGKSISLKVKNSKKKIKWSSSKKSVASVSKKGKVKGKKAGKATITAKIKNKKAQSQILWDKGFLT